MQRLTFLLLVASSWLSSTYSSAQESIAPSSVGVKGSAERQTASEQPSDLDLLATVRSSYINAGMFLYPLKCDGDGNVYLRNLTSGVPAIHKLDAKGKEAAVFQPTSEQPKLTPMKAGDFSVSSGGYVYQIVAPREVRWYHVFSYSPDGALRSYAKLSTGFPWIPSQVAAFPSGNMLVTGQEYEADRLAAKWPFNGIFSPDGTLLKEIKLQDDDAIHDMAARGDERVVSPDAPTFNDAVGLGQLDAANDGNVYLMRRLSPAILYAISPEGKVLRRFTVDAGSTNYLPFGMHISGNRIAVHFVEPQNGDQVIKIVDLEGRLLATYHLGNTSPLGHALTCYSANPERFTFLGEADRMLTLTTAGPR